jgi:hypothetical protein
MPSRSYDVGEPGPRLVGESGATCGVCRAHILSASRRDQNVSERVVRYLQALGGLLDETDALQHLDLGSERIAGEPKRSR